MNAPILAVELEIDALRGDLRASGDSPRPIAWPHRRGEEPIGGQR
jgi:hypothetical protein